MSKHQFIDGPQPVPKDDPGDAGGAGRGPTPRQQDSAFRTAMLRAGVRLTDPAALFDEVLRQQVPR